VATADRHFTERERVMHAKRFEHWMAYTIALAQPARQDTGATIMPRSDPGCRDCGCR
jgi:hypothetical protein